MRGGGKTRGPQATCRWTFLVFVWGVWGGRFLWAQPPLHSVWEAGGVAWCGIEEDWTWSSDSLAVHTLNAEGAGTRVLWGCATSWPTAANGGEWRADIHWHQGVAGSNANRSAVLWTEAPSPNPVEAVAMLSEFHQAGWLDQTGGVAAGINGQEDPLRCHAPGLASWEHAPTCHRWSEPFTFRNDWLWTGEHRWMASAQDEAGRRDAWVDTLTPNLNHPPCIGIELTHTSSHGNEWAFGWRPLEVQSDTVPPVTPSNFTLEGHHIVTAIVSHDSAPWDLQVRQFCEGFGASDLWISGQPTSCENVWQWTLPCPLDSGASALLNLGDESHMMWSDGTDLLEEGQLCFTEVMADPTPAMHAPQSTYLEVLNDAPWAIQPERLVLMDSQEPHSLQWVTRNSGSLLLPGERMLIVDEWPGWMSAPWSELPVTRAMGWSGLRDEGESVSLESTTGLPLERLTFWDTWWDDAAQDGLSLSCVHPHACDHPDMWKTDPLGASPGQPSSLEGPSPWPAPSTQLTLTRSPEGEVEIAVNPPLHNDQMPWVQWMTSDSVGGGWASWQWDNLGVPRWTFPFPFTGTETVSLHLAGMATCHPGHPSPSFDTLWISHRPPAPGDIQLSEILPVTHPVVEAEFVEWANVSEDTLSWGSAFWPPGTALVQSSQPRARFASWMTDSLPGLWQIIPNLTLTNAEGTVDLQDAWGNTLATSTYSECGHDRRQGTAEGRSMEHHPKPVAFEQDGWCGGHQFWRTNPSEAGMSPGVVTEWDWSEVAEVSTPSWGVLNGRWVMTVPQGSAWGLWASERWEPPTTWRPRWHRGVLLAQAPRGPEQEAHGPQHLTNASLSFPLSTPAEPGLLRTLPTWNEVLLEPRDGFGTFAEWATAESPDWTLDYAWSSDVWAQPGDFEPVSDITWWVSPSSTLCLAECPTWVESSAEGCLAANVPSFHGERHLTLRTPAGIAEFEVSAVDESAWVTQTAGVSLARIPNTPLWTSTPPPALATPGRVNGSAPALAENNLSSSLRCSPSTVQPGASWDKVALIWVPPEDIQASEYSLSYGVLDPDCGQFMQQHQAHWAGHIPFQWAWDATQLDGSLVLPGSYLGVMSWHNLTLGQRGTEKCIIGVAPP